MVGLVPVEGADISLEKMAAYRKDPSKIVDDFQSGALSDTDAILVVGELMYGIKPANVIRAGFFSDFWREQLSADAQKSRLYSDLDKPQKEFLDHMRKVENRFRTNPQLRLVWIGLREHRFFEILDEKDVPELVKQADASVRSKPRRKKGAKADDIDGIGSLSSGDPMRSEDAARMISPSGPRLDGAW